MLLSRLSAALLAAAFCSAVLATPASADTYALTVVAQTQSQNFYGIDNLGNFTVNLSTSPIHVGPGSSCGAVANAASCFQTFYVGNSTPVFTTTPPALTWDNGASCTPAVGAGFSIASGLCNGAHFLASGLYTFPDNTLLRGIWSGPNPDVFGTYLSNGSIDGGFMNSLGDAVFIDGLHDTLVFADDLSTPVPSTVPEPATFALLGTGTLGLLGALRFRR